MAGRLARLTLPYRLAYFKTQKLYSLQKQKGCVICTWCPWVYRTLFDRINKLMTVDVTKSILYPTVKN